MARSYSIALYTLRVKESVNKNSEIDLKTKVGLNNISFYNFIEKFVEKYHNTNYESKKSVDRALDSIWSYI